MGSWPHEVEPPSDVSKSCIATRSFCEEFSRARDIVQCEVALVCERDGWARTFTLRTGSVVRIGRCSINDVILDFDGISSYHAELFLRTVAVGGGLCVRDNSKNGTGARVEAMLLRASSNSDNGDGSTWQPLRRGAYHVLQDKSQLMLPMRSRKTPGDQFPTVGHIITVYISGTVLAEEVAELDGEAVEADELDETVGEAADRAPPQLIAPPPPPNSPPPPLPPETPPPPPDDNRDVFPPPLPPDEPPPPPPSDDWDAKSFPPPLPPSAPPPPPPDMKARQVRLKERQLQAGALDSGGSEETDIEELKRRKKEKKRAKRGRQEQREEKEKKQNGEKKRAKKSRSE